MNELNMLIGTAIKNWELQADRLTKVISPLSDDAFNAPLIPGRNRPLYIVGHLVAITDAMLPVMELGGRLYPELDELFVTKPDDIAQPYPAPAELKTCWGSVSERLFLGIAAMRLGDWLAKHSLVSTEDFLIDPSRNRFAVLLNRTNHMSYHLGQLRLARR